MEPTEFWANVIQLTAVLALALVLEVRAMYVRVLRMDKPSTRLPRLVIAVMYALTVLGMLFTFFTSLRGMAGNPTIGFEQTLVVVSLWFTFVVLVGMPTLPLLAALIEDLPISPEAVSRAKLRGLKRRVGRDIEDAERRVRSGRLGRMMEASSRVVEASSRGASEADLSTAMDAFNETLSASKDLEAAKAELMKLLLVLDSGREFSSEEARRWRLADQTVRAAGRSVS